MWNPFLESDLAAGRNQCFVVELGAGATPPSPLDSALGWVQAEFFQAMDEIVEEWSPTGSVALAAHDFGAAWTWLWVLSRKPRVEWFLSLSVGPTLRYDVAEHGPRALVWAYSAITSAAYYMPRWSGAPWLVGSLLRVFSGYPGPRSVPRTYAVRLWPPPPPPSPLRSISNTTLTFRMFSDATWSA